MNINKVIIDIPSQAPVPAGVAIPFGDTGVQIVVLAFIDETSARSLYPEATPVKLELFNAADLLFETPLVNLTEAEFTRDAINKEYVYQLNLSASPLGTMQPQTLVGRVTVDGVVTDTFHMIYGSEEVINHPDIPPFPARPQALSFLMGGQYGMSWVFKTLAEILGMMGVGAAPSVAFTSLTGDGENSLDSLLTDDASMPLRAIREVTIGTYGDDENPLGVTRFMKIVGTTASNGTTVQRGLDYDSDAPRIWVKIG